MKNKIVLSVIITVLFTTLGFASNKHYYFNRVNEVYKTNIIYSVDLVTGQKEVVFSNENKIYGPVYVLEDQSRIFFKAEENICVYNTENESTDTLSQIGKIEEIEAIAFVPFTNKIFLSFIKKEAKIISEEYYLQELTNISIDKETYVLLDTIDIFSPVESVVSRNGDKVYSLNKTTNGIYFKSYSIKTDNIACDSFAIEGFENLQLTYKPHFIDANNGYVFVSYLNQSITEGHLIVCDPEERKSITHLIFPIGLPYSKVVIQNGDVVFQNTNNLYIYCHESGKLKKRLKFQTSNNPIVKSKFIILGDSLYYFPVNPEISEALSFNVQSENIIENQSDESLMNFLLDDIDELYQKGWITNQSTFTKYENYFNSIINYLQQGQLESVRPLFNTVIQDLELDNGNSITNEAFTFLYFNAKEVLRRLPEVPTVEGLPVKLQDSQGNLLQGGYLQYYEGGWQDATNNGDGTFTVETDRTTLSIKMLYAGGSQQQDNVTVGADTAVFQTSDIVVKLLSSQNTLLDSGLVQYYASGWQDFGTLANGVAHKELLSKNYTFKIKYAGSEKNIVQNLDTNTTVTFRTVNTEVQLKDSQGNFLDGGTVEYFASGWKDFGVATNGKANKELLSRAYTLKMHYANAENNLVQNLDSSTTVVFNTVNATVQLKDSQNNLLDGGVVQYFASGWQDFGTATNGVATKELLPKSYNFKMKYGGTDKNIVQDLAANATITFNTVNTEIQLRDSQGNLLDGGFAKYYASGWKDFGSATNGIANKELLSRAYTFKIQYGGADMNHVQNLDTNTTVVFNTISVTAQLKDSQGNLLDGGTVEYYAAGWKPFGAATNGVVAKELLAKSYTFKILLGGLNTTKVQNVSANSTVDFITTLTTIKVKDNQNQPIENAEALYYGGGWQPIGNTNINGEVSKELLARSINFKAKQGTIQKNKLQDISTNSVVEIILE